MRVVFCGSPDFAIPSLRAVANNFEIVGVFTQPDKINGNRVIEPIVKTVAKELGLNVYQFDSISKEGFDTLRSLNPECIVTCAFGQFLYRKVINLPKYGVINVHGSILPKYRGASPIQSAVLNGEKETGVTIMRTAFEMDSGDVLLCERTPIRDNESAGELFDRLSFIGADALIKGLKMIEQGIAVFTPQDHSQATYCKKLTKDFGLLDFNDNPYEIQLKVRGLNPWPSAYTYLPNGKLFKIHQVEPIDKIYDAPAGEVVNCNIRDGIIVSCTNGALRLLTVQEEGGKKMTWKDFVIGHDFLGMQFKVTK